MEQKEEMSDKFLKKLEDNPFVYHYTSVDTLFAILEGYRQIKCLGLPFRAHCIYNVNDPREMELGFETVKKFLPHFEAAHPQNLHLSEVYENACNEKKCIEKYNKKPLDGLIDMGRVPYTISFSCKRDFLPMWSMYGNNNKKGVCLKFNLCNLIEHTSHSQLCFVYYDGDKDNLIETYLFPLIYGFGVSDLNKPMSIDDKIEELSSLCEWVSPFIKTRDWAYEQEFRFVYSKHYSPLSLDMDKDLLYEYVIHGYEKQRIIDYIPLPIPANSLDEIIIGPLADYKTIKHILRNELEECLLNKVEITPSSIQIRC